MYVYKCARTHTYMYYVIMYVYMYALNYLSGTSILLFKGFLLFGFLIFQFKNAPTLLCLSRDKTKGHSGKNATLTPTKTLPKKQDYSPVIFQIALSMYKLDSFFKKKKKTLINQILKIKTLFFLQKKKKPHHTRVACVMRLVITNKCVYIKVKFIFYMI